MVKVIKYDAILRFVSLTKALLCFWLCACQTTALSGISLFYRESEGDPWKSFTSPHPHVLWQDHEGQSFFFSSPYFDTKKGRKIVCAGREKYQDHALCGQFECHFEKENFATLAQKDLIVARYTFSKSQTKRRHRTRLMKKNIWYLAHGEEHALFLSKPFPRLTTSKDNVVRIKDNDYLGKILENSQFSIPDTLTVRDHMNRKRASFDLFSYWTRLDPSLGRKLPWSQASETSKDPLFFGVDQISGEGGLNVTQASSTKEDKDKGQYLRP